MMQKCRWYSLAVVVAMSLMGTSVSAQQPSVEDAQSAPEQVEPDAAAQADNTAPAGEGDPQAPAADDQGDAAEQGTPKAAGAEGAAESVDPQADQAAGASDELSPEASAGKESEDESAIGQPGVPGEAAADEEPALGPGGRPLRKDYPGTSEAMQPRMDTDRIEGESAVLADDPKQVYDLRVRELETKINDLKERVFRSKSRVVQLTGLLLTGQMSGSRAVITHKSELGNAFKLRRALYSLDGNRVFNQLDKNNDLAEKESFEVFNGSITPGSHTLSVYLVYQGSGYGLFSYFEGYKFDLRSSCKFMVEEGRASLVDVMIYEKGDAFTSVEDRPDARCEVSITDFSPETPESTGVAEPAEEP